MSQLSHSSSQPLLLRRYEPRDLEQVWWLHVEPLRATGAYLGHNWYDDLRDIQGVYLEPGGEFLVGALPGDPDRLLAMGALRRTGEASAEVKRMRVHPEAQGRGYGRQMLVALEARAAELGFTLLHLDTSTLQMPARQLYESAGYVEVRRAFIRDLEVIFYEKHLGAWPA